MSKLFFKGNEMDKLDEKDLREAQRAALGNRVSELVAVGKNYGFIITVEQRPLEPLAMGNYETVFSIRDDSAHVKEKIEADRLAKLAAAQ